MNDTTRTPAELRSMFGANLRRLARAYPSVSAMCRELGINRTQFNRYLAGESFPRPDVLDRICRFFDVDARILLEPLDQKRRPKPAPATGIVEEYLAARQNTEFPQGFYVLSATDAEGKTHDRLLMAKRAGAHILIRGFETESADFKKHEVRGFAAGSAKQIYLLMSRRSLGNGQVVVLAKQNDAAAHSWLGHANSLKPSDNPRPVPVRMRHLGPDIRTAIRIRRTLGQNV